MPHFYNKYMDAQLAIKSLGNDQKTRQKFSTFIVSCASLLFVLEMGTLKLSYRSARWLFSGTETKQPDPPRYIPPPLSAYSDDSIRLLHLQTNYSNRPRRNSI
jgi:hypothetical protein